MQTKNYFDSVAEVIAYLASINRYVGKTKLYKDITAGKLPKRAGRFYKADVDRYALPLPARPRVEKIRRPRRY